MTAWLISMWADRIIAMLMVGSGPIWGLYQVIKAHRAEPRLELELEIRRR